MYLVYAVVCALLKSFLKSASYLLTPKHIVISSPPFLSFSLSLFLSSCLPPFLPSSRSLFQGSLRLGSLWNCDSELTYIPDGGGDQQGQPCILHPSRPPFRPSHPVSHPHVCDWGKGVELLVASVDKANEENEGDGGDGGEGGDEKGEGRGRGRLFKGEHALHVVEVLQVRERERVHC